MTTRQQCEKWVGDKKSEYCKKTGIHATQTYGRRETRTEYQYGWSCSACDQFMVTQRFTK
jgi:hypothetical protein